MLRAAVKEATDFGMKAKSYMDRGELLPDDVIIGIVAERLDRDDTRSRGYILDGFPRTVPQAESLAEVTAEQPLDMALDLEVPEKVVLDRISKRRVCTDCGTNFSVDNRPHYDWTCDNCGGDVVQRDDDTPEAVRKRLDLYAKETEPLVAWYYSIHLLVTVDGLGTADDVTARLVEAIERRRVGA
jgi:adenylate kinase